MILYILHQILIYVSGGLSHLFHTYSRFLWDNYIIHVVKYFFPSWCRIFESFVPYILYLILPICVLLTRPPSWRYFDPPRLTTQKLLFFPRCMVILSKPQMNNLSLWRFDMHEFTTYGYYPIQRMVTNAYYLFQLPRKFLQKFLHKQATVSRNKLLNQLHLSPCVIKLMMPYHQLTVSNLTPMLLLCTWIHVPLIPCPHILMISSQALMSRLEENLQPRV